MKRLIFIVLALLGSLILEDQVQAQLVWNPTIFAPAVNPPGGANNYGESSGQGGFIFTGPIAPANPTEGMLWYDNSTVPQTLKIWDGTTWVTVLGQTADNSGPTPPSNPTDGQLWYDTSTLPATLKVWDGTTWVTVRAGILNSPTFAGSITILNNATVNGPDGSTWTSGGINNLKNLNIATGGALTFHGVPIGGACAANQFMISLSSEIIPTCAAITNIPGPVTINNPTFTGTVTMPDGSTWNNTGLSVLNTTVINGPDGSVWNSTGITNVKNISLVTGGAITIGGQPVSGGAHVGPTAPSNPVAGQLWFDTSTTPAVLKIWSGTAWVVAGGAGGVGVGPTAPSNPSTGNLWSDTSTVPPALRVWNGTAWVATNSAFVNATAPSNASDGQFWFNTSDLQTYVRFNSQWVAVVNVGVGGGAGGATVGPTAPASPKTGELWYDSVAGALKVWNGSTWASTAPSGAAPSSITDAMLVGSYSGVGACSANQYVTALTRNSAPTCAAVTLPAGVTLNNPTLTGTITLPDGSTWTSTGLTIAAGSRAHTLDSLTGASGSTTGALQRASNGTWSVAAVTIASGTTIVSPVITSPSISNPTFSGTISFPNASIADAALANSYSGVGTCTAGQFVNTLNRNAGPTCASPSAGNFAPFVNPANGQNNYAPLANAAFSGTMTINGVSLANGPWLPVYNPTFTGLMTGPTEFLTTQYTPALSFGNTMARPYANISIQNNVMLTYVGAHWNGSTVVADATGAASIGIENTPNPIISFNLVAGLTVGSVAILPSHMSISPQYAGQLRYEGVVSLNAWVPNITIGGVLTANVLQINSWGNWPTSLSITNGLPGVNANTGVWLNNDQGDWGGMQLTNTGWTLDGNGPRSFYVGSSVPNGVKIRSEIAPTVEISYSGYASLFRVIPNILAGLDLPGFGGLSLPDYGVSALHLGNVYFKGPFWAQLNISTASYQIPNGTWMTDGGAGSGETMFQLGGGYGAGLYWSWAAGANVPITWQPNMTWWGGRAQVVHQDNNQNYGVPTVWGCGGAQLQAGSRDSFGEVYCPEASQDMGMNFAQQFVSNTVCTFSDDGQPLIWFAYNKGPAGMLVQCRNMSGPAADYCWGPQWMIYHCAGLGG